MKRVHTAQNPAEAHLVAGLLEEAGIRTLIEGEMLFGARGEIGLTPSSLPSVSVADEDVERALSVLRERGSVAPETERVVDPADDIPRGRGTGGFAVLVLTVLLGVIVAWTTGNLLIGLAVSILAGGLYMLRR